MSLQSCPRYQCREIFTNRSEVYYISLIVIIIIIVTIIIIVHAFGWQLIVAKKFETVVQERQNRT